MPINRVIMVSSTLWKGLPLAISAALCFTPVTRRFDAGAWQRKSVLFISISY
jgi:hypothetical protein